MSLEGSIEICLGEDEIKQIPYIEGMMLCSSSGKSRGIFIRGKQEKDKKKMLSDYPELKEEWDFEENEKLGFDFYKITAGSGKKAAWKCKEGHKWKTRIYNRVNERGCPECAKEKRINSKIKNKIKKEGSLADKFPKIAAEWNYSKNTITPDKVLPHSNKKYWFICAKCHNSYQSSLNNRTNGRGCPYCSIPAKKVLSGFNDLCTTNPELLEEWNYEKNKLLNPSVFTSKSGEKVWWKCNKGHEWKETIAHRTSGRGCPYCCSVPKKVLSGFNDLQTKFPEIAVEWDLSKNDTTPDKVIAGSAKKYWFICPKCNNSYQARIFHRTNMNSGCPYCSSSKGEKIIQSFFTNNNLSKICIPQYVIPECKYKHSLLHDFGIINPSTKQLILTIEFNGEQHYRPVDFAGHGDQWAEELFRENKIRDEIKSNYLAEHNIPQLVFTYKDSEEDILKLLKLASDEYNLWQFQDRQSFEHGLNYS